jgi:hypothetical protein
MKLKILARFLAAGYELFPLVGKKPAHKGWRERDYSKFDTGAWLKQGHNIGIRLRAGDLIIDCDPRNYQPGDDPLARLAEAIGAPLRGAPATITGSGGLHLFFRKPPELRIVGKLAGYDGLDILTLGKFIVAPGSFHPETFREYVPEGDIAAVRMAPDALLELLARPDRGERVAAPGVLQPEELAVLLKTLDPRKYGQGNYADWIALAAACHDATNGHGLCEWVEWCAGDPDYNNVPAIDRAEDTWASFEAGRSEGATYRSLFRAVRLAGRADLVNPLEARIGNIWDELESVFDEVEAVEAVEAGTPKKVKPPKYKLWTVSELALEPAVEWVIEGIIPKQSIAQLYGPTKEYKTFVALDMCLCVAMGQPYHGKLVGRCRVVYLAGEGQSDVYRRVRAWCIENKVEESELEDWFRVVKDPCPVDDVDREEGELLVFARALKAVQEFMPVGLLGLDTVNKNMKGDENDGHAMSLFVKGCELLKSWFVAAILIIHHAGHNRRRARGSSVLISAVDASLRCAKLGRKEDGRSKLTAEHIRAAKSGWSMNFQSIAIVTNEATNDSTLVMRLIESDAAPKALTAREGVLLALASAGIEAGGELGAIMSVRALAKVTGKSIGAIQNARVDLRDSGHLDHQYKLTTKGLERALELGTEQTSDNSKEAGNDN